MNGGQSNRVVLGEISPNMIRLEDADVLIEIEDHIPLNNTFDEDTDDSMTEVALFNSEGEEDKENVPPSARGVNIEENSQATPIVIEDEMDETFHTKAFRNS